MPALELISSKVGVDSAKLRDLDRRGLIDISRITRPDASLAQGVLEANEALKDLKWLAVVNASNWDRLQAAGLTYTVFPPRRQASMKLMRGGNSILFYVSGVGRIVASAEILGTPRHANLVWPTGVYPYRVELRPELIVAPKEGAKFSTEVDALSIVSNKAQWEGSVRCAVRLLPLADFTLLRNALLRAASGSAQPRR